MMDMDGIINLYKPSGITSHKAVQKVKGILKVKKAGHAGTLDPFAEGVLLVCLGKATRITEYLSGLNKEYLVEMLIGIRTDTFDLTGVVIENKDYSSITEKEINEVIKDFIGPYKQTPPIYSAKKKQGIPLYKYARKGIVIGIEAEEVFIHELHLVDFDPPTVRLKITCSKGTYVRSLVNDLGQRLGTGATVKRLKRTAIGNFTLQDAVTMEMLLRGDIRYYSIDEALYFLPDYILNERELFLATHGTEFKTEKIIPKNTPVKLKTDNKIVAIGFSKNGNILKIKKVLKSVNPKS